MCSVSTLPQLLRTTTAPAALQKPQKCSTPRPDLLRNMRQLKIIRWKEEVPERRCAISIEIRISSAQSGLDGALREAALQQKAHLLVAFLRIGGNRAELSTPYFAGALGLALGQAGFQFLQRL